MSRYMGRSAGLGLVLAIGLAAPVRAAGSVPVTPETVWAAWTLDPLTLAGLGAGAYLYGRGLWRIWGRVGLGRGIPRWQAGAFASGKVALVVALVSPLDALSTALFSAHMVQHLLLMLVAAPLLVLAQPHVPMLRALRRPVRRRLGALWRRLPLYRPGGVVPWMLTILAVHAAVTWLWHAPPLYQAALQHWGIHLLEHALFFGTAALFWWMVFQLGRPGRPGYGVAVPVVFVTMLQSSMLGMLLTLSPAPLYPAHAAGAAVWGLSPLQDQQLAGLIMWVPAGLFYVAIAVVLFGIWLAQLERTADRGQRSKPLASRAESTVRGP